VETTIAKQTFQPLEAIGAPKLIAVTYRPQLHQHLHDAVAFPTQIGIVATEDNLVMLEAETVIEILTVLVTLLVEMTIARSTFHLLEAIGTNLPIVAKVPHYHQQLLHRQPPLLHQAQPLQQQLVRQPPLLHRPQLPQQLLLLLQLAE